MHDGSISANEGCDLAKNRAKLKAMNEVLGQTISLEEIEKCSGIDGKVSCERNQFFLSSFNGDITGIKFDNPKKTTKSLEDGEMIYFCEVKIEANVTSLSRVEVALFIKWGLPENVPLKTNSPAEEVKTPDILLLPPWKV